MDRKPWPWRRGNFVRLIFGMEDTSNYYGDMYLMIIFDIRHNTS